MDSLRRLAPPNVVFTGFVPDEDYVGMMKACDVVVDLSTREDCLVCGAYEAVAAGRPIVLSNSPINRTYFSQGVVYTDNTPDGIAESIRCALTHRRRLEAEIRLLRTDLAADFDCRIEALSAILRRLSASQKQRRGGEVEG